MVKALSDSSKLVYITESVLPVTFSLGSNYPPISSLSSLSKRLEENAGSTLPSFLECKTLITKSQVGFKPVRSCSAV